MDTKELHIVTRAEVERIASLLTLSSEKKIRDMLLALLEAKEAAEKDVTQWRTGCIDWERENAPGGWIDTLRTELANAQRAIERKDIALRWAAKQLDQYGALESAKRMDEALAYTGTAPLAGDERGGM